MFPNIINVSISPSAQSGNQQFRLNYNYPILQVLNSDRKKIISCREPILGMNGLGEVEKWSTWFFVGPSSNEKSLAKIFTPKIAHRCLALPMACQWNFWLQALSNLAIHCATACESFIHSMNSCIFSTLSSRKGTIRRIRLMLIKGIQNEHRHDLSKSII